MKIRVEYGSAASKHPTGVGYYTRNLTEALARQKNSEVSVVYFDFLKKLSPQLPSSIQNITAINFPQRVYAKLHKFGMAVPFDILLPKTDITFYPNYALWPTTQSTLRVVTIHDLTYLLFPEMVENKNLAYLRAVVPRSISDADVIVVSAETVKHEIEALFSTRKPIVVVPIPPASHYFSSSDRSVHKTYSIPTEKYILFASTIEPRKNLDVLLDAYQLLPRQVRDEMSLVIAGGSGWKSEGTQNRINTLHARGMNIVQTGYFVHEDAPALYQKATMLVMPSHYEGFGMPIVEAMASKVPVIASDIPVLKEVGGDACLYFQQNNPESLAAQIGSLVHSPKLRHELKDKGSTHIKPLTWDSVAEHFTESLNDILSRHQR